MPLLNRAVYVPNSRFLKFELGLPKAKPDMTENEIIITIVIAKVSSFEERGRPSIHQSTHPFPSTGMRNTGSASLKRHTVPRYVLSKFVKYYGT